MKKYIPILKDASIVYRRPAMSDMSIEAVLAAGKIEEFRGRTTVSGRRISSRSSN